MALPPSPTLRNAGEVSSAHYVDPSISGFFPSWVAVHESLEGVYAQSLTNVHVCLNVFKDLGAPIAPDHTILDFGCGEGRMIYHFRKLGYQAFGMDIAHPLSDAHLRMTRERLRKPRENVIRVDASGKIPFPDNHFDVVISWEAMDHVQDYELALSEIRRVLKPGGKSFLYFPSRYRILEPHVSVPFATVFQSFRYLLFWAEVGIRRQSQLTLTAEETARENFEFLKRSTNYLRKKDLIDLVLSSFGNIRFVEETLWKYNGGKTGFIYRTLSNVGLSRLIPAATCLVSPFARRAIFFEKQQ